MKTYSCVCQPETMLFFESTQCIVCGRLTGYDFAAAEVTAFEPDGDSWRRADGASGRYLQCANYLQFGACNGMLHPGDNDPEGLCFACRFNNTIPDLSVPAHLPLWRKLESAKRATFHTLLALGLPLEPRTRRPEAGIRFEFLADRSAADHFQSRLPGHEHVFTGHADGIITINLAEADDVARTDTKVNLGERYRTLLGHFRHELGHYYWDLLVADRPEPLARFRELFGDETQDYQAAIDRHYQAGPPAGWEQHYISAYATMHPWEDWAETFAHYLHIIDTLETAQSFGIDLKRGGGAPKVGDLQLPQAMAFYGGSDIEEILTAWMRFSVVLNALNRSMGLEDPYPFVLTPDIRAKLKLVSDLVLPAAEPKAATA